MPQPTPRYYGARLRRPPLLSQTLYDDGPSVGGRGYANFQMESVQVQISPDKEDMFINLNVSEGEVYRIADAKLAGKITLLNVAVMPLAVIMVGLGLFIQRRRSTRAR